MPCYQILCRIALCFLLLAACKVEIPPPGGDISVLYKEWTLIGIDEGEAWLKVPAELRTMSLTFKPSGELSLVSSCNYGEGVYEAEPDGKLLINIRGLTKVACLSPAADEWEFRYIELLSAVQSFGFEKEELWLWSDPDKYLRFHSD